MAVLGVTAVVLGAPEARAYEERIHALITERIFTDEGPELAPPTEDELQEFREAVFMELYEAADPERREFLTGFAMAPDQFQSEVFKRFLLLNRHKPMYGIDTAPPEPMSERRLRALASRWPDDDGRNQDRLLEDETGAPVLGPDGEPLPVDPAILHMGKSTGLSSQAHAHYELFGGIRSDDPDVLKKEPRMFSMPADARSFGRDYAAMYERLALIAQSIDSPVARWMRVAFEGNALHHIQDACNQIHTVQVGDYEYFRTAWTQVLWRDLVTAGGLFGERLDLKDLGVRYLTNHHLFIEELMARELLGAVEDPDAHPEGARLLAALTGEDDPSIVDNMLASIPAAESAAAAAMTTLSAVGSQEVPDLYRLARDLSSPRLMTAPPYGMVFDTREFQVALRDPMHLLRRDESFVRFFDLHARAMKRCGTVLRHWRSAVSETPRDAAEHLLRQLFDLHNEAAVRQTSAPPPAPKKTGLNWVVVGAYALLLGGAVAGVVIRRRRRRS